MRKEKPKLLIEWCSYEAAKYACVNWHYSECMPVGKLVKLGVWEDDTFIGVIIFGHGANNNACKSFNLKQEQVCELVRVALKSHKTPVSRMLKIGLKLLKNHFSGIKLVFSYSDITNQGHHGGIYQANNWSYLGVRKTSDKGAYYKIKGQKIHGRSARSKYGNEKNFPPGWEHWPSQSKHLYVKIINSEYNLNKDNYNYPRRQEHESNAT